jgi:hypothetical protein
MPELPSLPALPPSFVGEIIEIKKVGWLVGPGKQGKSSKLVVGQW